MADGRTTTVAIAAAAVLFAAVSANVHYSAEDKLRLRERVSAMFHHAYDSYLENAYPYDELRPLSCDGVDTWGEYSLTLVDALDTLAVIGNYSEFRRVYGLLASKKDFLDADINVSVFETNIRIVGGLIGAHLMAKRAGVKPLDPGWPCAGPLLRMAEDAVARLLPAFDTPTGMPYGTVNLRHGVPSGETPVTCTAGVGTMIVEFGALSRLTGNPLYEETAMRALRALWHHRSSIGLVGNHIDVLTGKWTATDAGIGAGVDSYYEYLVKGAVLLQRPELMHMFRASQGAIEQYLRHDDWYFWVAMKQGTVTLPVFQSLEAFWPGLLSLVGENVKGLRSMHNYHQVWKQYGFLPEFYNVAQGAASSKRDGYPLRPELIESAMYLYRATGDPFLLRLGEDAIESIEHSARVPCGYATVKDVRDHTLEDRMESFVVAETTKYLYLLFDEDNFIHNPGSTATVADTAHGQCVLDAGGYVFNSEAHPVDPAALSCCSSHTDGEIRRHVADHVLDILDPSKFNEFRGDLIPARIKQIEEARRLDYEKRAQRKAEYERKMQEQRQKEREALRRRREAAARKKGMENAYRGRAETARQAAEEEEAATAAVRTSPFNASFESDQRDLEKEASEAAAATAAKEEVEEEEDIPDDKDVDAKEEEILSSVQHPPPQYVEHPHHLPDFPEEGQVKVKSVSSSEDGQPSLLIKRQSKDEAVERIEDIVGDDKDLLELGDEAGKNVVDAIADIFSKLLPTKKTPFDLDAFRAKVMRAGGQYRVNESWKSDHFVMSCPPQAFLERFAVQGEFPPLAADEL